MEDSAHWATVGAVAVALIAAIGNIAVTVYEKWSLRDFTQDNKRAELDKAHEGRPWSEMGRRIEDLKEEVDRLERQVERRDKTIDEISEERDRLRVQVVDWQIEARKASGALARVTELQQQCDEERKAHQAIVERLTADIRRLRGDH